MTARQQEGGNVSSGFAPLTVVDWVLVFAGVGVFLLAQEILKPVKRSHRETAIAVA